MMFFQFLADTRNHVNNFLFSIIKNIDHVGPGPACLPGSTVARNQTDSSMANRPERGAQSPVLEHFAFENVF
jgi:hypothetical protein